MADTRKFDLEQLCNDRQKARNVFERDKIDKTIDKIMRENGAVRQRREKLIMAVRNKDKRAISRFTHELMMIKANQTYGKDY